MTVIDQETMPASIEATLNYIVETDEEIFTQTAAPGSLDVRAGGKQDPRRVTIETVASLPTALRWNARVSALYATTPRSVTSSTRMRYGACTIRKWRR